VYSPVYRLSYSPVYSPTVGAQRGVHEQGPEERPPDAHRHDVGQRLARGAQPLAGA
jgi:hypothetical protein